MGQAGGTRFLIASAALALAFGTSCRVEEPLLPTGNTGSSSSQTPGTVPGGSTSGQLSAPVIADPLSGSTVSETQPTLTVLNSGRTGGTPPTYLFQVSTEASFTSLIAQSPEVPEGSGGSTAWRVERALSSGTYHWRVRARSGSVESSFSGTATFTLGSGGGTTNPPPSSGVGNHRQRPSHRGEPR